MGFLSQVVERVRRELREAPPVDQDLLDRSQSEPPPLDFAGALATADISLIAEIKRSSPSAGLIAEVDPGEQAARYERGGASAISVLTEEHHFGGSGEDLRIARQHTSLPILRKDFVVDHRQILEARAWGADAVLLIAAALSAGELSDLVQATTDLAMAPLVEAHHAADLELALATGAPLVGVNARDLETLRVDFDGALAMARSVPADRMVVLESGIASRDDVIRARDAGARAVLVGEALIRAGEPEAAIRRLLGLAPAGGNPR